jgi:hypothetical protein
MKEKNRDVSSGQPWYSPSAANEGKLSVKLERVIGVLAPERSGLLAGLMRVANGLTALLLSLTAGIFGTVALTSARIHDNAPGLQAVLLGISVAASILSLFFLFRQMGTTAKKVASDHKGTPAFQLGLQVVKGEATVREHRRSLPAPELALLQFVNQVRAYAAEKSYQKSKNQKPQEKVPGLPEPVDLLKRRWNDVTDSLNEFEIYLAGDPRAMIDKLIARYPSTQMDVSKIFRDVAESFDTAWRSKGINIESAIVTPLKASTSEPILRRILVGPWRANAYFARRGNGVVFSAQSQGGAVEARWECEGMNVPEEFLKLAQDPSLSVNERIERGMEQLAPDPQSSNTLFALISLITWIDLAQALNLDYSFKNTSEGLVTTLKLL